jgi:hypothetical protein
MLLNGMRPAVRQRPPLKARLDHPPMSASSTHNALDPSRIHVEAQALENLVVAAAVNKRLLMRILARLEGCDLEQLHDEVEALDREFRSTVRDGMSADNDDEVREEGIAQGDLPVGREEERRGHGLANSGDQSVPSGNTPMGKDQVTRKGP